MLRFQTSKIFVFKNLDRGVESFLLNFLVEESNLVLAFMSTDVHSMLCACISRYTTEDLGVSVVPCLFRHAIGFRCLCDGCAMACNEWRKYIGFAVALSRHRATVQASHFFLKPSVELEDAA